MRTVFIPASLVLLLLSLPFAARASAPDRRGHTACVVHIAQALPDWPSLANCLVDEARRVASRWMFRLGLWLESGSGDRAPFPGLFWPLPRHNVFLTWTASVSQNVVGYNIYRGDTPGGPYTTKLNSAPVPETWYIDFEARAGHAYYYVTTAVDAAGNESAFSEEAGAVMPPAHSRPPTK